jgi:hypothetical protein
MAWLLTLAGQPTVESERSCWLGSSFTSVDPTMRAVWPRLKVAKAIQVGGSRQHRLHVSANRVQKLLFDSARQSQNQRGIVVNTMSACEGERTRMHAGWCERI